MKKTKNVTCDKGRVQIQRKDFLPRFEEHVCPGVSSGTMEAVYQTDESHAALETHFDK